MPGRKEKDGSWGRIPAVRAAALFSAGAVLLALLSSCQNRDSINGEKETDFPPACSGADSTKAEETIPSPSYAYEYALMISRMGNTRDILPAPVVPEAGGISTADCRDWLPDDEDAGRAAFETERYGEDCFFVRLLSFSGRDGQYGVRMASSVQWKNGANGAEPVLTEDIPFRLTAYMGYVIEHGEKTAVYSREGECLLETEADFPAPANTRDADGAPLFLSADGAYLKIENGVLVPAAYDDARDSRGLYFDYPSSYGTPDGTLSRISEGSGDGVRYGYADEGGTKIPASYERAFAFRGGAAVVKLASSGYGVIGEDGGMLLYGSRYYTNENRRRVLSQNAAPADPGLFGLGAYYRDHGLIRVHTQDSDFENGEITADRDWLMQEDGSEFAIPSGFSLVAYSDGVLLLRSRNTGYYGMYAREGYWVAQPVFSYARPFVGGVAVLGFSEGYRGAIDTEGNVILPFRYTVLSDFSSGLLTAYSEIDGWEVFATMRETP